MRADVTIVVVPRERYGKTEESLRSFYEHTEKPFEMVCVTGGAPPRIVNFLREESARRGFELIETEGDISPNHARNLGLQRVKTKYVAFADNDLIVTPGWLDALVRCAEETGAAIVGPLYFEGNPENQVIHMAGGFSGLERRGEREILRIIHRHYETPLKSVKEPLGRERCFEVEFHAMLVRTSLFETVGPLDENLTSMHELLDICYLAQVAGHSVYFEPASVVTHTRPPPWEPTDLPFFLRRWSDAWSAASLRHFDRKWGVHSEEITFPWIEQHRFRYMVGTTLPGNLSRPERPEEHAAVMLAMLQTHGAQYVDIVLARTAEDAPVATVNQVECAELIDQLPGLFARAEAERVNVFVRPRQELSYKTVLADMVSSAEVDASRVKRIHEILPKIPPSATSGTPGKPWPRPMSDVPLVHVEALDTESLETVRSLAFLTLEIAPGRFDAWISVQGADAAGAAEAIAGLLEGTTARIGPSMGPLAGSLVFTDGPRERRAESTVKVIEASGGNVVAAEEEEEEAS